MTQPIAVTGIDVRVPGADDLVALTRLLLAGHVRSGPFPEGRLRDASLASSPQDHYEGSFFERIDRFDHRRHRLSARVAATMDPFQRWCLASATRAVADAGLAGQVGGTRTGVYAACNGLQQQVYATLQRAHGTSPDLLAVLASSVAARISHHLDLHGPASVVDTACSSGLYALTQACRDLADGVVDTAIVTAANLYLDPGVRGSAAVDVISARSRTRAFDAAADGASMGEGVVTVVLRRAGQVGGDPAYGVIEGWAVGQDGRTATMAAPNPAAQIGVVDDAWRGHPQPSRPALLVSHGTGTAVGDAIELEALSAGVLAGLPPATVALISPKANLGHLDAASGLLSLVVAVVATASGQVPPHPSFQAPAASADLAQTPFYIPVEVTPIAPGSLAGVSSFGMTGTNVHVVVRGGGRIPVAAAGAGAALAEGQRCWYPVARNTFAKPGATPRSALGVRTLVLPVETHLDWEIAEHRVQGRPLMVGTSVVEILARLVADEPAGLAGRQLTDLTIRRPLEADAPQLELLAALDERTGVGTITSRRVPAPSTGPGDDSGAGDPWQEWVSFRLAPADLADPISPLTSAPPTLDGMVEQPVTTTVGDDATVQVSGRWAVTRSLHHSPADLPAHWPDERVPQLGAGSRGVLELAVPGAYAAEAAGYAAYPPVLDAALNGLNALLGQGRVLLPWHLERLALHTPRLGPGPWRAHLQARDVTDDGRGNLIVTLDVDLWDAAGSCLLSARGYRVKNRAATSPAATGPAATAPATTAPAATSSAATAPATSTSVTTAPAATSSAATAQAELLHTLTFTDPAPARPAAGPRVALLLGPGRTAEPIDRPAWAAVGCPVVTTPDDPALAGVEELLLLAGPVGSDVAAGTRALADLLVQVHQQARPARVVLVEPGLFGPTPDPARRARAAAAYSLRTELRFDVAVIDAAPDPDLLRLLADVHPSGLLRQTDDGLRAGRFTPTTLARRPWPADTTRTVLVVGASSGIGRGYAQWLSAAYPKARIVGCGRRAWVGPEPGFDYLRADVTDPAAVARLAAAVGRPELIVFSAGEPASGLHVATEPATFEARMASKVLGPRALLRAFPDCPEIVLFSSVAGTIGALGQAEYAAANAYLTGLAEASAAPGQPRIRSLALTGWSEIGMSRDLVDDLFVKTTPTEGLAMLHHVVESTAGSTAMFRLCRDGAAYSPVLAGCRVARPAQPAARPAARPAAQPAARPAAQPASLAGPTALDIQAAVLGAWQRVLGPDDYALDVTFSEYGGDSVSVVHLCQELGRDFPDIFDVTTLFSCATVGEQVRWVQQALRRPAAAAAPVADITAMQQLLHPNGASR